ncbi:MAG: hypothetical protein ABI597_06275, partial [Gammaproteobacteria bacterium]
NRKVLRPLVLGTTAITLHRLQRPMTDKNNPAQQEKFGTFKILAAFVMTNENTLRANGYTPSNLYQSGMLSFQHGQKIRARIQYRVMLRFTPDAEEANIYEQSGNDLSQRGYENISARHWTWAFAHGHKPYVMSEKLGDYKLTSGNLKMAEELFTHLIQIQPNNPIPYNKLGVTHFMRALCQDDMKAFCHKQYLAKQNFEKSLQLDPKDTISKQNHAVASVLTVRPEYGSPWEYLRPTPSTSTRMIDAIMHGLSDNRTQTKSSLGSGASFGTDSNGQTTVNPTVVVTSYEVPRFANEFALQELSKLKAEEYQAAEEQPATPKPNR